MADSDERSNLASDVPTKGSPASGSVDNRDTLKPGQWDRSGAGEIESDSPSSVGKDPAAPGGDNKTSAGT